MRSIIHALAVMVLIAGASFSTAPAADPLGSAEDEAAIRAIIIRLRDAWNAGDSKAFAAPFAEDADYVIVSGRRIKGRAIIDSGHREIFDTVYRGSQMAASIQSVRFLREDVAVAHIEWHLKYREGDRQHERKAICTMVHTKQNGQWSITAFHNTAIAGSQK